MHNIRFLCVFCLLSETDKARDKTKKIKAFACEIDLSNLLFGVKWDELKLQKAMVLELKNMASCAIGFCIV